ncbi:MAG TPA: NAD-dependent epimerase/dehydratase family protein [Blastocatellia bacterium]|jgi:UDP-glucose 4-epimerase|nr:NAD-dependent epimerase/dehydratase family protein [Blastocatellia bacterium]
MSDERRETYPVKELAGKNVLVTGGLGFIGSNLAHRLVSLGSKVTLVDSLVPAYGGNPFNIRGIESRVHVNIADVRDEHSMSYLVRDRDYIFNLAGQVSHIDSMEDPYTDLEINVRSQISLLEACRKNNSDVKIVYTSTRQLYGKPTYLPVDEDHLARPTDVNGINKLSGELFHILYHNVHGVRAVSLRLTNTYGPRQLIKHARQGFIGWFVRQIVEGSQIQLYGDGSQIRDLNHVDDVVDAMLIAAVSDRASGQIYNLGGDEPVSLKSLVELMIDVNGGGSYRLVPFPAEKRAIDIGDFYGDYSRIKGELGWSPRISLRDGLRHTFEFYRENIERYLGK